MFRGFDDLSLGRWMAQTLGQIRGRCWRLSHPLLGAYRLAAQAGHERQIWLKHLIQSPSGYPDSECCRAPLLPLLTRDVLESGLVCQHCSGTAIAFEDLPADLQHDLQIWSTEYQPVHAVAHWDDHEKRQVNDYQEKLEEAATEAELLLSRLGQQIGPRLLEYYPVVLWEDQDECLEVRPEDIPMS